MEKRDDSGKKKAKETLMFGQLLLHILWRFFFFARFVRIRLLDWVLVVSRSES